ncbi:hypothetical protein NPIL_471931 [Nephila pilipes]|uniref:Uncharacterized protein n=1 Tax=Nephila pilipes TaxID=299642 RepID=A0A8X6TBN7_NEPPI|nr:hypothetical protein NPIL_471931 [Nephila pilipes]
MGKIGVLKSYCFRDDYGDAIERYNQMLNYFFFSPEVRRKRTPMRCIRFSHEGITALTAGTSMDVIPPYFRLIARFGDTHWYPRSSPSVT